MTDLKVNDKYLNEEELENTPKRWLRFFDEWEQRDNFKFTSFENPGYDEMIILKDISFNSLCSHHILPFHGNAYIGYIPDKKICGISKLARVVNKYAHKPQVQEKLTEDIANYLEEQLKPLGLMVVLKASHDCMTIRGVNQPNTVMVTSSIRGIIKEDFKARNEFLELIK